MTRFGDTDHPVELTLPADDVRITDELMRRLAAFVVNARRSGYDGVHIHLKSGRAVKYRNGNDTERLW